jgi:hypothetical protein
MTRTQLELLEKDRHTMKQLKRSPTEPQPTKASGSRPEATSVP